jgi:SAM-dependent methyltransferase
MAFSYAPPLVVEAAVRHGVFDALDSGPKSVIELSEATGASPRGLRAILNLLVGVDLLRRQGDRYGLTAESAAFLVSTKPSFQGGIYRHLSRDFLPAWLQLHEIVRTGLPNRAINEQGSGADFFGQLVEDIMPMNFPAARALAAAVADLLRAPTGGGAVNVLDIASGSGVWGIALAQKSPTVQVTAVDWPAVTPITRRIAARHGVGARFHIVEGDLLEADFGVDHRVATLGHILHSEGETRSRKLLKKVFDALGPGGTIAIAEFLPNDDRTGPTTPLIFAVNMLVNTDEGDAFTFPEIKSWLTDAGFENPRLLDAPSVSPLILATRPSAG